MTLGWMKLCLLTPGLNLAHFVCLSQALLFNICTQDLFYATTCFMLFFVTLIPPKYFSLRYGPLTGFLQRILFTVHKVINNSSSNHTVQGLKTLEN